MSKKKVSVVIATYNQERFLTHTLESVVNQKVEFDFEVLVGDDCSSDNTAAIVRKYAEQYPDIIVPFIREKNLGMAGNVMDLTLRAKGEYIAFIEGDDYWIDDEKLKKQVDFLDNHPDYIACFGKFIIVDENEVRHPEHENYGNFMDREGDYTIKEFEKYILPGQTATSMYRNNAYEKLQQKAQENGIDVRKIIDRSHILCMLSVGKMYVMGEYLSAYRLMLNLDSGSWSSKNDNYKIDSLINYLDGLKFMEKIALVLKMPLDFDDRRTYELGKLYSQGKEFSKNDFKKVKKLIKSGYNSYWKYIKGIFSVYLSSIRKNNK